MKNKLIKHGMVLLLLMVFHIVALSETLKVLTMNWEPFYGADLTEQGFYSALTREAFKRAGYDVKIDFVKWKDAQASVREGQADVFMGVYHSKNREKNFVYSDVVASSEEVFIALKSRNLSYQTIDDLKGLRIASLRGATVNEVLAKNGMLALQFNDYNKTLKRLLRENTHIDLAIMGRQLFNHLMEEDPVLKRKAHLLTVLEPAYKNYNLHNLVTRKRADAEVIIKKFNQGLQQIKDDGTYDAILRRFGQ